MRYAKDSGVILGGAVLAVALVVFVSALSGALVSRPADSSQLTPRPASGEVASIGVASTADAPAPPRSAISPSWTAAALPVETILMAADRAPFDPDRQAPYARYLMPEDRVVEAPRPSAPPPPPPPPFRVLGTIATANGGVAVMQVQNEPPLVVAVGEEIMGYRLASVDGGRVLMSGQGQNFSVLMDEAGASSAVASARGGRAQQGRGGRAGGAAGAAPGRGQATFDFDFRGGGGEISINGERINVQDLVNERMQDALRRLEQQRPGGGNQTPPGAGRAAPPQRTVPRPPGGG